MATFVRGSFFWEVFTLAIMSWLWSGVMWREYTVSDFFTKRVRDGVIQRTGGSRCQWTELISGVFCLKQKRCCIHNKNKKCINHSYSKEIYIRLVFVSSGKKMGQNQFVIFNCKLTIICRFNLILRVLVNTRIILAH